MDRSYYMKEMSKHGTFLIKFYKVDGILRTMLATTDFDKLPSLGYNFIPPKGVRKSNDKVVVVWDLQNNGFRSFRPSTVVEFKKISEDLISSWNPNISITKSELLDKLSKGNLKITFKKSDGSDRVMNCTRNHIDLLRSDPISPIINVWDIDKSDVRNINYDRIMKIENSDIKLSRLQELRNKFNRSFSKITNFAKRYGSKYFDPEGDIIYDPYDGKHSIFDPDGSSLVRINNDGYYEITNLFDAKYIHDHVMKNDGVFPKCVVKIKDGSLLFSGLDNVIRFDEIITTGVTNMYSMFSSCVKLRIAPELDTRKVTDMSLLFAQCYNLKKVPEYNVNKVTEAFGMFSQCDEISDLPKLKFRGKLSSKESKREIFSGFFPNDSKVGRLLLNHFGLDKWFCYLMSPKLLKNKIRSLGSDTKEIVKTANKWKDKQSELKSLKDKIREKLKRFKIV